MATWQQTLIEAAKEAALHSYSPYSNFAVGAALLSEDGTIISGCNVENASYGLTMCAERGAIQTAIAKGYTAFKAIAIVGLKSNPCMPCGACRQVMLEFDIPQILLEDEAGHIISYTMDEMLPHSFGPKDLE